MNQEREVKFYLQNLEGMKKRLLAEKAVIVKPRVFECNLRFDTQDGKLSSVHQVLRLRQDSQARLTFKGAADANQNVSVRQELEVQVSDFETARCILLALGYVVIMIYEKYRTTYHYGHVEIVLDEMPFGSFMEIEGPDEDAIQQAADILGLDWTARSTESYLALFDMLRSRGLEVEHLTFESLTGKTFTAADFGLCPGDS